VLEAATAPESFGGPLRRFRPDLVLLVDAVQMDAPPGAVAWIEWERVDGLSASTHTLPPSILATYLMSELQCQVPCSGSR
jgi:hydrogenase 3 maturation protease